MQIYTADIAVQQPHQAAYQTGFPLAYIVQYSDWLFVCLLLKIADEKC